MTEKNPWIQVPKHVKELEDELLKLRIEKCIFKRIEETGV